jgi:hypothetical protein
MSAPLKMSVGEVLLLYVETVFALRAFAKHIFESFAENLAKNLKMSELFLYLEQMFETNNRTEG